MTQRRLSKRILRNITTAYHRANDIDRREGLYWYETAHNDAENLAKRYGISVFQSAGVIAALSPSNAWGANLLDADKLLGVWASGGALPAVGVYGLSNVLKSYRILNGPPDFDAVLTQFNVKTGPKTWAFYQLIADPLRADLVCVDRHAKAIALGAVANGEETSTVSPSEFRYFAAHYVHVANLFNLLPHQVQAITWVTWRRLGGQLAQLDIPF